MRDNFYKDPKWLHKRAIILCRDEYMCRECKRYGKTTAATTVHHIIPLAWCLVFNILLALANINLISLCSSCHDKMHIRATDKLTETGLQWVRRMGEIGIQWIEKYSKEWR